MKAELWIVDDDHAIRWVLERALSREEFNVRVFSEGESVLEALKKGCPQALITDILMPGMNGLILLERIHQDFPELPVIVMTAHSDLDSAVASFQGGAFEYLPKPFDIDDAITMARRAIALQADKSSIREENIISSPEHNIIGIAPGMQEVFCTIGRLSRSHITVMINGESGTGKELIARALHNHSPREQKPFVAINTATIPKELLESEPVIP